MVLLQRAAMLLAMSHARISWCALAALVCIGTAVHLLEEKEKEKG